MLIPSVKNLRLDFYRNDGTVTLTKDVFANCDNLEELILVFDHGEPEITAPDAFEKLPNLKKLAIQDYNITLLTENSLKKLINIILLKNIEEIDAKVFENFNNLKEIAIVNNRKLTHLTNNLFKNVPKLKKLSLFRNRFQNLTWDEFEGLSSLEELNIFGNRITSFNADKIATYLPNLQSLSIKDNPLSCKQREVFVEKLKAKLSNLEDVSFKVDSGYYDSCEQED
ncbi:LRR 8 domain containing protein [Asbolus verrucosus]|uniref:LRR 8 domain containing protein n=1 Tax=Asbolus verrucosus TaxID=1661398 RepID=A0A482VDG7_ASBVE|nr:LRR 8 domain containing protein [Asbolus verrucosus]